VSLDFGSFGFCLGLFSSVTRLCLCFLFPFSRCCVLCGICPDSHLRPALPHPIETSPLLQASVVVFFLFSFTSFFSFFLRKLVAPGFRQSFRLVLVSGLPGRLFFFFCGLHHRLLLLFPGLFSFSATRFTQTLF